MVQQDKINYWSKIIETATSENGLYDIKYKLKMAFTEQSINKDEFRKLNSIIDDKIYNIEEKRREEEQERLNIANMSIIACLCG